jgi:putative hydrolase of the HAD superfamily
VGAAQEADEEVTAVNGACRAVVFDLWNTIAAWPHERWEVIRHRLATRLELTPEEFDSRWYGELAHLRETRPFADVLARLDVTPEAADEMVSLRRAVTRQGLVPVDGVVETITALRGRGLKIGLITVCSEDVPLLWEETQFHGLFDAEVFSATCGLRKPDPRIYGLALDQLGVKPEEAVFVGDGANDELAGAERVGMTAVGVDSPGGELPDDWNGPRIRALPELLELV